MAMPQPSAETEKKDNGKLTSVFSVIAKNTRSLEGDEGPAKLFEELLNLSWDAVLLSETWRPEQLEDWLSEEGHRFRGAGCDAERRRVAILLSSTWARNARFTRVS